MSQAQLLVYARIPTDNTPTAATACQPITGSVHRLCDAGRWHVCAVRRRFTSTRGALKAKVTPAETGALFGFEAQPG